MFSTIIFSEESYNSIRKIDLKNIQVRKEYAEGLKNIAEYALSLYKDCYNDGSGAAKRLETISGKSCSLDPTHMEQLLFTFCKTNKYGIEEKKKLCCHIHLKLIRDDSNHGIYFFGMTKNYGMKEEQW